MADTSAQAANAGDQASQNNQQTQTSGGAGAQSGQGSQTGRSAEEYEREIKETRAEAAGYRTKLRELEEKVKGFETDKLSETEKLTKKAQEAETKAAQLEARIRERTTKAEVKLAAQALGVVDPEAAYRLLDADQVTYDDNGEPTNVEKLLKEMVQKRPYLLGGGSGASAANAQSAHQGTLTRDDIKKMSPDEINRRWDDIQKVLSSGR